MKQFDENSGWFKGNLHTHTTVSDGIKSPEECIKMYKEKGYDFLALTDHRKLSAGTIQKLEDNRVFTLISGVEYDLNDFKTKRAWHIVGIGMDEEADIEKMKSPQDIIDAIHDKNGLAIVAHPAWSLLTHDDLLGLKDYDGLEIWNTISDTNSSRGDSTNYVDVIASKGLIPRIFAADDTHFYKRDAFGGYIMVNCKEPSRDQLVESILAGRFYCSQGPEIKQISIQDGLVSVETSPVRQISFLTDTFYDTDRVYRLEDQLVTKGEYKLKKHDSYVRIECTDEHGKKAWSQLIVLKKEEV